MDKSNEKENRDKAASKKAAVLGTQKKKKLPLVTFAVGVCVIAAAVGVYLTRGGDESHQATDGPAVVDGTFVILPTGLFEAGKARHFEYPIGKDIIRYFVLKSSDGVIRVAFDACDVCWPAGKGYFQDGDHMVCRNCGRKFASVLINEVKGGCNPAPLDRKLEHGKLIIHIKDIEGGRRYFNFSGKV